MKHSKIDISVIIVNFNSYGALRQLLDSLVRSYDNLSVEFIIIDNSLNKDAKVISSLKKKYLNLIAIDSKSNLGYAKGVNLGISKANGKYLVVINPDVVVLDGSLSKLYQFAEKHEKIGALGPMLLRTDGDLHFSCRTFPGPTTLFFKRFPLLNLLPPIKRKIREHMMFDVNHNKAQKVDWISGAFMFVRREAIDEVGLMDERFFLYLEDVDWCRQFWQNGYEVWYYPKAKSIHIASHLSTQFGFFGFFRKISWIHVGSYVKYLWKYRGHNRRKPA